jgi:hypothetical protein
LIVCERQAAAQSAVRVELDVTSEAHRGTGSEGSLEWTIRAGASICECLRSHHAHVECWLGGEVIAVGETNLGRVRLMDRLARVPFTGAAGSAKSVAPGRGDILRIVCTTPVGQAARRGSVVDRQTTRWVMISSPALPADAMDAGGAVIRLRTGDGHDPASQFSRDWERFCHAATR